MDNFITGLIAVAMFLAFVVGLADSIAALPFVIIVAIVSVMMITDFIQSAKQGFKEDRDKTQ